MANQEIHNYLDEQTTPNESDFLDIDADLGGGNWLSKKLSLFNIRKWLFKLVSQEAYEQNLSTNGNFPPALFFSNVLIYNISSSQLNFTFPGTGSQLGIYATSSTYVIHIYNLNGGDITLSTDYITEPNNPPITTTVGGYAQVWLTYHKKADNTEYWTANTINFS